MLARPVIATAALLFPWLASAQGPPCAGVSLGLPCPECPAQVLSQPTQSQLTGDGGGLSQGMEVLVSACKCSSE